MSTLRRNNRVMGNVHSVEAKPRPIIEHNFGVLIQVERACVAWLRKRGLMSEFKFGPMNMGRRKAMPSDREDSQE